jgi:hypothetical protein
MANTFPSSGFVGIGTASPNYLLDIPSNNNLYLSNLYITGCSLNPILSSGGTGGSMCLQGGGAGEGGIRLQGAAANTNGHISFLTNQVEAMRINTGGNVGIGLSSPCGAVDVYKIGSGAASGIGDNLILRGGNNNNAFGTNQIRFGYSGGIGYSHAIKSRHNSGGNSQNALDFFLWTTADCAETVGSKNVMTLESTGNVGMGTCTPNISGFTGTMLTLNGTGNYQGLEISTCGGARMTMLADISGTLGYISTRQAGMSLVFETGAASEKMRINCSGNVGINCATPTYKLHVNGTFYAAGSSQDYKQSICNYNTDSCMFMKLKPVTYQYKEEYCHLGKELKSGTQIGLIAEEVAETYPELAILVKENDNDVVRNVDYEKLSIVLLAEVQKLRKEVDDLKTK